MSGLDPFREKLMPDVVRRFNEARQFHQKATEAMWRGVLSTFSSLELSILADIGFLSAQDGYLMHQAERIIPSFDALAEAQP
jgi:hypothetical protein